MSRRYAICGLLLFSLLGPSVPAASAQSGQVTRSLVGSCSVSHPNGGHPPGQSASRWYHGTHELWVLLEPNTTALIPPQNVLRGGWLYLKVPWWRGPRIHGQLRVHGRRLDRTARALRADVPVGYGDTGFQASALLFPTVGCWQITGRAGTGRLTFVMRVVKARR